MEEARENVKREEREREKERSRSATPVARKDSSGSGLSRAALLLVVDFRALQNGKKAKGAFGVSV